MTNFCCFKSLKVSFILPHQVPIRSDTGGRAVTRYDQGLLGGGKYVQEKLSAFV